MTPIQEAMCRVIRDHGWRGLDKVKKNSLIMERELSKWTITLDGHTLTQGEYDEWLATKLNNR